VAFGDAEVCDDGTDARAAAASAATPAAPPAVARQQRKLAKKRLRELRRNEPAQYEETVVARRAHISAAVAARGDARKVRAAVHITVDVGRYHVVRRLLAAVGLPVFGLHRIGVGPIRLARQSAVTQRMGSASDVVQASVELSSSGVTAGTPSAVPLDVPLWLREPMDWTLLSPLQVSTLRAAVSHSRSLQPSPSNP
jgi:hypothetical protein